MQTKPSSKSIKLKLAAESRRIDRMMGSLSQPGLFTPALDPEGHQLAQGLTRRAAELQAIRNAMASNPAKALFDEVLVYLRRPLFDFGKASFSDRWGVKILTDEPEDEALDPWERPIAYEAWGKPWVTDNKGYHCSMPAILDLQAILFWESLEEMGLEENGEQKWDVLRWVFKPSIRRSYIYDRRIGRSHCLQWHERDETFSFHNCCIAARMDEEEIREGFRRNIPVEIIQAVERYYAH